MSEKVTSRHLERKAILYIRQSSSHQVLHNEESRRLQYAMAGRLRTLGWTVVEVIDDNLGQTASGATDRGGFQRMLAEVCLGKVGAVAAQLLPRTFESWAYASATSRILQAFLGSTGAVCDQQPAYRSWTDAAPAAVPSGLRPPDPGTHL